MATTKDSRLAKQSQHSTFLQPREFLEDGSQTSTRPTTSRQPSWVGPQRSAVTRSDTMAQKVQIHFRQPDLQPPVYIAGSLGESQWEPIEMVVNEEDGGVYFSHEFDAEPGDYQYKFRLGPGDWWVLDESKPIVDDGAGNRNNLLVVEPASTTSTKEDGLEEPQASMATAPIPTTDDLLTDHDDEAVEGAAEVPAESRDEVPAEGADEVPESELNLLEHETNQNVDNKEVDQENDSKKVEDNNDAEQPPLLEHEEGPFKRVDSKNLGPLKTDDSVFADPSEFEVEADDELKQDDKVNEDDELEEDDDDDCGPPLFRHESMSANDADPDEAPLFRHESMSPLETYSVNSHSSPNSRKRRPVNTEDVEDPSLEPFPTDQAGILAHLQRTETRLREDETAFEGTPLSPSLAQKKSFDVGAPFTQEHTNESNELAQLDSIDEREESEEEEEAEEETNDKKGLGLDAPVGKLESTSELVSDDADNQDASDAPLDIQPSISHGPLTPPMTPTEHAHDKASAYHDGSSDTPEPALPAMPKNDGARSREANGTDHITSRSTPPGSSINIPTQSLVSRLWFYFAGLCGGTARATGVAFAMSVAAAAFAMNSRS